jgi:hypothetical protein
LLGLVEMDVVEVHPWAATVDDIEHPDLLMLDLDPGAGVAWEFVIESALRLRKLLHYDGRNSPVARGCTLGSRYRSGRSPDWIKSKNPDAPAVQRETEEDWGRTSYP